jgi:hypothetical protein
MREEASCGSQCHVEAMSPKPPTKTASRPNMSSFKNWVAKDVWFWNWIVKTKLRRKFNG